MIKIRVPELPDQEIECDTPQEAVEFIRSLYDFLNPVVADGLGIRLVLRCRVYDARGEWADRNVSDARRAAQTAGWWVAWPVWKSDRALCPLHRTH